MLREFFEYILQRIRSDDLLDAINLQSVVDPVEAFCLLIDTVIFSRSYSGLLTEGDWSVTSPCKRRTDVITKKAAIPRGRRLLFLSVYFVVT